MSQSTTVNDLETTTFSGRCFTRNQLRQVIKTVETFQNLSLKELALIISADSFISQQACGITNSMPGLSADVLEAVNSLYCLK